MRRDLYGLVTLPASKSESNRALMIAAYGGFRPEIANLSEAHDTRLLQTLLDKIAMHEGGGPMEVDCEDAGTVARFLLTFLAGKSGTWRLTGTERMCQRPMKPLVDALRAIGADITCEQEEGFLPMRVKGVSLNGGSLAMDSSLSSQFASSLLLAAPMWRDGLSLRFEGKVVSRPYINLTIDVMRRFGAQVTTTFKSVTVAPTPYTSVPFTVGGDWTAASYWYELAALNNSSELVLQGLDWNSRQGDKRVMDYFTRMGVVSFPEQNGVRLVKMEGFQAQTALAPLAFDFTDCPDLFPAVFVACVANNYPAAFYGIQNLATKESNRVDALLNELLKYYTLLYNRTTDRLDFEKSCIYLEKINDNEVIFNTFLDHRIAMSLAPLALLFDKNLVFDHPEVVVKSYPNYWVDLQYITNQA